MQDPQPEWASSRGRRIAAALAAVILATLLPEAARAACPSSKTPPTLRLKIDSGEVLLDHSRDREGIKQISDARKGHTQGPSHVLLGFTVVDLSVSYNPEFTYRDSQAGAYCAYLDTAEITVGYSELSVYVSSDYPEGSCEYEAILAHELRHVEINQSVLKAYRDRIWDTLARTLRSKRSVLVSRKAEARSAFALAFDHGLQPVLKALTADRIRRNNRIDTEEHYRRVLEQCRN